MKFINVKISLLIIFFFKLSMLSFTLCEDYSGIDFMLNDELILTTGNNFKLLINKQFSIIEYKRMNAYPESMINQKLGIYIYSPLVINFYICNKLFKKTDIDRQ